MDICQLRSEDGRPDQLVAVKRLKPNAMVNLHDLANEGKILRTLRHRCARPARRARRAARGGWRACLLSEPARARAPLGLRCRCGAG